jgi:hypothetical protein
MTKMICAYILFLFYYAMEYDQYFSKENLT